MRLQEKVRYLYDNEIPTNKIAWIFNISEAKVGSQRMLGPF